MLARWLLLQIADSAFPDGRVRALRRPRGGDAATGAVGDRRGPRRATCASTCGTWAAASLPFVDGGVRGSRRTSGPSTRGRDATLTSHVAEPREPHAGARVPGDVRADLRRAAPCSPSRPRDARGSVSAHLAPMFGASLAALGVGTDEVQALHLYVALRGVASAAVRLGVVGPHEAQRLQRGVTAHARRSARRVRDLAPDEAATARSVARPHGRDARPPLRASLPELRCIMAHEHDGHDTITTTRTATAHAAHEPTHDQARSRARAAGHTHEHWAHPGRFRESRALAPPRLRAARLHRRNRRAGRQRQDRARPRALRRAARPHEPRRRHQRHLHARGRRVPAPASGAAPPSASAPSRPAAARTPRSARTSATTSTRSSSSMADVAPELLLRRERRRQPRGAVQPRARRLHDLRHRRRRRRQGPAKGRPRHHAIGSARDQQDRSRAARRREPRGDGARRAGDARRRPVRLLASEPRRGARGDRRRDPRRLATRRGGLGSPRLRGDPRI